MLRKRKVWPRSGEHDPALLAAQHWVLLRENRNPYSTGTKDHATYEAHFKKYEAQGSPLEQLFPKHRQLILKNREDYNKRASRSS